MDTQLNPGLANELRTALDVMEEQSHLGLDDVYAGTLRTILLRKIEQAEASSGRITAQSVRTSTREKIRA